MASEGVARRRRWSSTPWSARVALFLLAIGGIVALSALSAVDAPGRNAALTAGYVAVLAALAAIDVRRQVIPNALVYPALLAALFVAAVEPEYSPARTLGGSAAVALPFLVLFLVASGSIGGGDVKMAALVGAMVGWSDALTALLFITLSGGTIAVLLLAVGSRSGHMPYGPFLAVGGLGALLTT